MQFSHQYNTQMYNNNNNTGDTCRQRRRAFGSVEAD